MLEEKTVVAFGLGRSFFSYVERLDSCIEIAHFCDNNIKYHNKRIYGDDRICISPEKIKKLKQPFVIITVDRQDVVTEIEQQLQADQIPYMHAREILEECSEYVEKKIEWPELMQRNKIHRFIDLNMHGTTMCNFHCEYCYVWRQEEFKTGNKLSEHTVEEIRRGLSQERVGGVCFINMCARGETMLSQDIVELVRALLEEGHYVSVVTNGTVTKRIEEILEFPEELQQRMFFKLSFHYKELKRLGMSEVFWNNVNSIKKSKCSYTLEVTPGDGSVELIGEMKEMFKEKADGAFPHISFTRDSTKKGFDLLSDYTIEEYRKIWGQFDSKMFELKSEWYGRNMTPYKCYAGNWGYLVNLLTGDIKLCYRQDVVGNIFDESMKTFPVQPINHDCHMSYCFNNHAFMAWGCLPEIPCYDYKDMRNRTDNSGHSWLKEGMFDAMNQKLNENNFEHLGRWSDYGKLYQKERRPAIVLFNSPDYSNLGDHAISIGERFFFEKYFKRYDVIEISCTEYERENLRIKSAIQKEDILVITGGGNIGSLWLRVNDMAAHIVENFPDNRMILFPQTLYFENNAFGRNEKKHLQKIYNKKSNLVVAAREEKSYALMKEIFGDRIEKVLCPDMAFMLRDMVKDSNERNGALLCIRKDKESIIAGEASIRQELEEFGFVVGDFTTTPNTDITLDNRLEYVKEALDKIGTAEIVVTDRLHCMIFCVLTNTPCVVCDNLSGKVFEVTKWFSNMGSVVKCEDINNIKQKVKEALSFGECKQEDFNNIRAAITNFAEKIEDRLGDGM